MSSGYDSPGELAEELLQDATETQAQEEQAPPHVIANINELYDEAQYYIGAYERLRDAERNILRWQDDDRYIGNAGAVSNILGTNYEGSEMNIYALRDRNFLYNPGNTRYDSPENAARFDRYADVVDNLRRFLVNRYDFNQVENKIVQHKLNSAERKRESLHRALMLDEDPRYQQQLQITKQKNKQKRKKELQRL